MSLLYNMHIEIVSLYWHY